VEFDPANAAFSAAVIFLAYMVRGIAGFGSGLISVPLLALVFPVQAVVPIIVLLDYVGSASQGIRNREAVAWREQLPLIPFTCVGVALGLTALKAMTSTSLAQALGAFVIVYAIYQLLPLPQLRGSRLFAVPCGFVGGLIGTLFGAGGPLYIIYFGLRELTKTQMRATFAVNFLIDGGIRLVAYALFGFFGSREVLFAILSALPVAAAALWLGGRVHSTMSRESYARLISGLLVLSGTALLLRN
jgi:uncharacterized membrane protein YfcA